ncbi:MAG: helix-turn-helix transcriptional regulator [Nitrososphaerota archaeon]|nr:helix-turn-helix transcriptional regulator [Nitrososphaerota archaeon]MDG7024548.1 helix-turn-helix transcriptional regulator [Nitrososphaerota archaeon]
METDWASLHKILSDTTRRSILGLLAEKESLTYTDMMTLLQITNTGRLNYHLKALGTLISKDEEGRYRLTEQGRQAADLLRTFPERVPPERKLTGVKVTAAVVLILIGVLLIASFSFAVIGLAGTAYVSTTESGGVGPQALPQNTTVSLIGWPTTVPSFSMAWSALGPVHIYVLNQTQNDALQFSHSEGGQLVYNFTGPPAAWSEQYYKQSGNVTVSLPPGQYHFYAWSQSANYLDSLSLSQKSQPQAVPVGGFSPFFFLFLYGAVFITVGVLLIVLAASILTHRFWR